MEWRSKKMNTGRRRKEGGGERETENGLVRRRRGKEGKRELSDRKREK